MDEVLRLLTVQFLLWAARTPRTYAQAMDAWRTSCPKLPVWEDALDAGLLQIETTPGGAMETSPIVLTPHGRAVLAGTAVHA